MGGPSANSSSSSDEEEDPRWKAAIESIASTTTFGSKVFGTASASRATSNAAEDDGEPTPNPQKLKHYQIKGQKLLDDILEKTLEIVNLPIHVPENEPENGNGVRLFKQSPAGIVFDHTHELQGPTKRPRIVPRQEIDKKSKKQIKSVAVDGLDIITAATDARRKSLARLEAKESALKEKAKKEEERVAELKRIRGERWLPSIARDLWLNRNCSKHV